jgi:hypothetical protein
VINCGSFIPGQLAGFLGSQYDPFIAGDPSRADFQAPGLNPLPDLAGARIEDRRHLLDTIDGSLRQLDASRAFDRMDSFYQRAYSLIESPQARQAFDLSREPEKIRQRYGLGFKSNKGPRNGGGMPHLGPSMLLARRLVEAGVRLVSIWASGQAFDTHRNHFPTLTNSLCPYIDRSFSALIEDLDERGLLDETLVVAVGEFGRTPKMGQITSSAGATPDGRDHWSRCYTGFLAGGGAKPGMLYGASDAYAAQPSDNPVTPAEFVATIYTLLGIDPHARLYDRLNRPHTITDADPISAIMA